VILRWRAHPNYQNWSTDARAGWRIAEVRTSRFVWLSQNCQKSNDRIKLLQQAKQIIEHWTVSLSSRSAHEFEKRFLTCCQRARYYSISGERGEAKKISLPRDLVVWEQEEGW